MPEHGQIDVDEVKRAIQDALKDASGAGPIGLAGNAKPTLQAAGADGVGTDLSNAFRAAVATLDGKEVGLDVFRALRPHVLDFGNTFASELSSSRRLGALGSLLTLLLAQYALYQPPPGR